MTVEAIDLYALVHPDTAVQYTFYPRRERVEVVHLTGRARVAYMLPTDEARQLWRRLTTKGYERF